MKRLNEKNRFLAYARKRWRHELAKRRYRRDSRRIAHLQSLASRPKPIELFQAKIRSLDLLNDTDPTIETFAVLEDQLLFHGDQISHFDLSECQHISPESALYLIAQMTTAAARNTASGKPKRIRLEVTPARSSSVNELLAKIGYYRHCLAIKDAMEPLRTIDGKIYLQYVRGDRIKPELVGSIVRHFRGAFKWSRTKEQMLFCALMECLNNVRNHAYSTTPARKRPWLKDCWWILASHDRARKEISFCCCDLGVGIPKTIRVRIQDQLPLFARTDEELIVQAVMEGEFSRTKLKTRGFGMPTLKKFTDEAQAGELVIISGSAKCTFPSRGKPKVQSLKKPLSGTMVSWTVRMA